jgi:predicted nucleic acid-binding protein
MPPTVQIEPPVVFIDTAGFIALYVAADAHHQEAIACREQTLKYSRLYTSSEVISETIAHIQRDHQVDQACLLCFTEDILNHKDWITLLHVDDDLVSRAVELVRLRNNRRFSLVDATNVLLMEKQRIDIIFSFDSLYDGESVKRGHETRFLTRVPAPAV